MTILVKYTLLLSLLSPLLVAQPIDIEAYFSKTKGGYYKGGVDNIITKDISEANSTINMAMYYLTNKNITKALIKAHQRGVEVKIVTDDKNINLKRYKSLKHYGVVIKDDNDKKALMHNKILIVDNHIVWIGSGNYTVYSFYRNSENFLKIRDNKIAKYYNKKFMTLYNNLDNISIEPYIDRELEIYFSKDSDIESRIIELIRASKVEIDIMMFAFTNRDIANELLKARERGVEVKIVIDRTQNKYQRANSIYNYLKLKGVDIELDRNRFKLHNKVMIIDSNITIIGSYNYTKKANSINDENILIIKDRELTEKYLGEFKKIKSKDNPREK